MASFASANPIGLVRPLRLGANFLQALNGNRPDV